MQDWKREHKNAVSHFTPLHFDCASFSSLAFSVAPVSHLSASTQSMRPVKLILFALQRIARVIGLLRSQPNSAWNNSKKLIR